MQIIYQWLVNVVQNHDVCYFQQRYANRVMRRRMGQGLNVQEKVHEH